MMRARGSFLAVVSVFYVAGMFAPAVATARAAAAAIPAPPVHLRGEAPHVELRTSPRHVAPGEEITVTGKLRGYELGTSDFCLKPRWVVYGSNLDGSLVGIPVDDDPVQCRDHGFSHMFTFTNAGTYQVRLELRTTGTKVRVADWGFLYVDIDGGAR